MCFVLDRSTLTSLSQQQYQRVMCWCTRWNFQFFLDKLSWARQEMGKVAIKATHQWGKIWRNIFCYRYQRLPFWSNQSKIRHIQNELALYSELIMPENWPHFLQIPNVYLWMKKLAGTIWAGRRHSISLSVPTHDIVLL